MIVKLLL
ncbi:hypothetical protein B4U79_00746 [Dinothrombium tinctorium]|nr:hypothetical protein B4U79_00746 [Dinothrombium tinctorium]